MSLTIRKLGNKNFRHEESNYDNYAANDITIIFDGNVVKLRSLSGRVVFDRDGYNYSNVTVYDIDGDAETFASIDSLRSRLIALGYPFQGGTTETELTLVDGGTA
jgi:hypothetical protein